MFDNLLESGAKKQTSVGQTLVSVLVHGILIYGAVQATQGAAQMVQDMISDTTVVFLTPPPPPPPPAPEEVAPPEAVPTADTAKAGIPDGNAPHRNSDNHSAHQPH